MGEGVAMLQGVRRLAYWSGAQQVTGRTVSQPEIAGAVAGLPSGVTTSPQMVELAVASLVQCLSSQESAAAAAFGDSQNSSLVHIRASGPKSSWHIPSVPVPNNTRPSKGSVRC